MSLRLATERNLTVTDEGDIDISPLMEEVPTDEVAIARLRTAVSESRASIERAGDSGSRTAGRRRLTGLSGKPERSSLHLRQDHLAFCVARRISAGAGTSPPQT